MSQNNMLFGRFESAYRYFLYRLSNFWLIIWGTDNSSKTVNANTRNNDSEFLRGSIVVLWRICEEERWKEKLVDDGEVEGGKTEEGGKETGGTGGRDGRGSRKAVKWTGGSSSEHKQNGNSRFRKGSGGIKCNESEIKKCISYGCFST